MHRLRAAVLRGGDQRLDPQIAVCWLGATQVHRCVGFAHMPRVTVGIAMHRHRAQAQLAGGTHDAAGDFAAIGNQQGVDHRIIHGGVGRGSRLGRQPGGIAFLQKGVEPFLPLGADTNTRDGGLGVTPQ